MQMELPARAFWPCFNDVQWIARVGHCSLLHWLLSAFAPSSWKLHRNATLRDVPLICVTHLAEHDVALHQTHDVCQESNCANQKIRFQGYCGGPSSTLVCLMRSQVSLCEPQAVIIYWLESQQKMNPRNEHVWVWSHHLWNLRTKFHCL